MYFLYPFYFSTCGLIYYHKEINIMNKKTVLSLMLAVIFITSSFSQRKETAGNIEKFFQLAESYGYSGNVLISRKGIVLLKRGYGWQDREKKIKETAETIFDVGSVTKQFTAAAILNLEAEGKLSVNDRLSKYFPAAPDDKKDITLHQLLTHSAGFPGAIGDDYDLITAEAFMELAFKTKLLYVPGASYDYSNVGYSILGIVIEKVSGKKYENYLHDALFVPAGMLHTGYLLPGFKNEQLAVAYRDDERWGTMLEHKWAADGPGWHLKANGGILSTLDDMYKWYVAMRNKTVLPASELSRQFAPHVRETGAETFYGYGWVIEPSEKGDTIIWHNGGNGAFNTYMGFDLKNDLVMIISSNSNDKITDDYAMQVREILKGNSGEAERASMQRYAGNYKMESGDTLRVKGDELNRLIIDFNSPTAMVALLSEGTEDSAKAGEYSRRTKQMLENAVKGDFSKLAEAWGEPVEEVKKRSGGYWSSLKDSLGGLQDVNVLGSVARSKRETYLSLVQVNFLKATRNFIYWWKAGRLQDMSPERNFSKLFFLKSADTFFAGNNNKTVVFKENSLQITGAGTDVRATKIR